MAFLYADLLAYGEPALATEFLNGYLAESGDYQCCTVLPLYTADRALVRAKVLALQTSDARRRSTAGTELLCPRHRQYLEVTKRALKPRLPYCVMMVGPPGSGKSWLAAHLVPELAADSIRSDLERKRLAGIPATASSHSAPGGGIYGVSHSGAVYERLGQCAAEVLGGRRNVIVDANFGKRRQRQMLAEVCELMAVPLFVVHCSAPPPLLRQRIAARSAAADSSEADVFVLELQLLQQEAIAAEDCPNVIAVDTAHSDAVRVVVDQLRQMGVDRVAW